jgi:electron-transferring-flavoprotein dehydrogenase
MPLERIEYDVVLVGGSPSNLALAHRLLDLAKESGQTFSMAILEKSKEFGGHICSGAVVKPDVIKKLFPEYETNGFPYEGICNESAVSVLGSQSKWDVPAAITPDGFKKEGYLILTLSHVCYWMANRLKEKAAEIPGVTLDLFPGFSAHELIFEGDRLAGVSVIESKRAEKNADWAAENTVYGKVFALGDKGFVSRQLVDKFNLRDNPQIWSVGVKEVWQLDESKDFSNKVWHTMGFPLVDGTFGGGFIYGMKDHKLTIGLIASLDSPNPNLNPQQLLQAMKKHPWIQQMIAGGKLLKYGAALLPEGGYYSLPKKFATDGAILLGDALGVLNVSNLNGVANSMECGLVAADLIHKLLREGKDFTAANLASYQTDVMKGVVGQSLYEGRYFRKAWSENPRLLTKYLPRVLEGIDGGSPWGGMISVGLKNNPFTALGDALRLQRLMSGNADIGPVKYKKDYEHIERQFKAPAVALATPTRFDKETIYSREDAVFYAGVKYHEENAHIDEFSADVCVACIASYKEVGRDVPCVSDCTAEVHRIDAIEGQLRHGMSLENCVQCRTCEFVCPQENLRVRPTEEGSGPDFMGL